jgi:hypothetical protein
LETSTRHDVATHAHYSHVLQLLVSSSVSMLVPLTIGKLIDFFSSANAVGPVNTASNTSTRTDHVSAYSV